MAKTAATPYLQRTAAFAGTHATPAFHRQGHPMHPTPQLSIAALHPEIHAGMVPLCAEKGLHIRLMPTTEALAKAQDKGWDIAGKSARDAQHGMALWVEGLDDHTPGLPILLLPVARSRIVPDGRLVGVEPIAPSQHPRDTRAHVQALFAAEEAVHARHQGATRPTYGRAVYDTTPLSPHLAARLQTSGWLQDVGPEQGPCPDPLPQQGIRLHADLDLRAPNGRLQHVPAHAWLLRDQDGKLAVAPPDSRFHSLGPASTPPRLLAGKAAFAVAASRAIQASPQGLGAVPADDGKSGLIVADRQDGRILILGTFTDLAAARTATSQHAERFLDKRASWRNAYQKGKEIADAYKRDGAR